MSRETTELQTKQKKNFERMVPANVVWMYCIAQTWIGRSTIVVPL